MTVCLRDKGLYSAERNYDIFAFIFGAGGCQGSCSYSWVMFMFMAHLCSKCLQT